MNTPHEHEARDREAREWAAQERARRQARDAAAVSPDPNDRVGSGFSREFFRTAEPSPTTPHAAADADAPYQRIAEALRRPPPVDLPADFAVHVARIAEARVPGFVPKGSRLKPLPQSGALERTLVRALVFVFALCAVATGLVYGARVLAQLQAAIGPQGVQCTALLAGCLGLSWSLDLLRRRSGHGDAVRPA
jgi:hypothetical protein